MNILFVGDIFGSAGRRIVREHIGHIRQAHEVELIVINAENAAGGFGLTPQLAEEFFDLGADVLTTGNHAWDKRELIDYMNAAPADSQERGRRVLRPANFQPGVPGYGVFEGTTESGVDYAVVAVARLRFYEHHQRSLPRRQRAAGRRRRPRSSWWTFTPKLPARKWRWAGIWMGE